MTNKLKSGFPPEAFDELSMLEDSSWWFRSRNQIIIWAIKKYAINLQDYLEIGCGTGYVLKGIDEAFKVRSLNGDEYYKEGLEHAKIRVPNASFRLIDATKMEDQDLYDAIGAFDVIEHIDNDQLVLLNCFQALKNQGHLFLTVPQHMWLWSVLDEQACHVRRYSKIELKQKVEKAGFKVIDSSSFISFLVPFMWLSRQRHYKKSAASQGELQPPAWLNLCFWVVMQLEIIFLKLGVRLPFGGSLILVAKKP